MVKMSLVKNMILAGIAALTMSGALATSTTSADAQVYYGRRASGIGMQGFRAGGIQGFRGAGFRQWGGYRPAGLGAWGGYRPRYGGWGGYRPRYWGGYRPAGYYGRYRYGYWPGYYRRFGYGYPYGYRRFGYGYGYPYGYRRYGYGYPYYYGGYSDSGAVVAGLFGGLALGALAATAAQPYYAAPAYRDCWTERRRFVNAYGNRVVRRVRVCG